jgi:hypothetical protein
MIPLGGLHSPQSPSASALIRPVPTIESMDPYAGGLFRAPGQNDEEHPPAWKQEPSRGQRRSPVI